jgi:energy-converting hydrogenase Eha subunit E
LLSIRSFEAVTGPKRDRWLVKTVGVLVTAVGVTLIRASRRRRVHPDVALLGGLSAAALAGIDLVYVSRRRISPVYLLDSVPEVLLALWWGRRVALDGRSRLRRRGARIAAEEARMEPTPVVY